MTTLSQKTGSLLHFQRNTHTFFAKCDKNKKPVTIIRTAVIACANVRYWDAYECSRSARSHFWFDFFVVLKVKSCDFITFSVNVHDWTFYWPNCLFLMLTALLLRDAIHKRGLCRHVVSVCPSRTSVLSKRINISSEFFHYRVASPFAYQTLWQYSDRDPLKRRRMHVG